MAISSKAKLDYKMDYLVVRTDESVKRVHLSEISVLLIESTAVSMTAYLLCELSKRKIDIIFCDEKCIPFGSLISFYGSHDTSLKFRSQIKWEDEIKGFVSAEELKLFYKNAIYEKFKILLLESFQHEFRSEFENIVIVDNDLCVI